MKLELKHLAPYCPYGLKVILGTTIRNLTAVSLDSPFVFVTAWIGSREKQMAGVENIKPILRPLSDLTKEIEYNGEKFVYLSKIKESQHHLFFREDIKNPLEGIRYSEIQKLLEWHFDVFGLIEKGLAIDINTL